MVTTRSGRWRRWLGCITLLMAWLFLVPLAARAETAHATLAVRKVKGADLLGRVAGSFRAAAHVPESACLVTFYLDGQVVVRDTSYPYDFQFDTNDFAQGEHRIEAVAHLSDGSVATSNSITLDFRSRNWLLAARHSLFLYAALVPVLSAVAGLIVHRLLRIRPRLLLLDR